MCGGIPRRLVDDCARARRGGSPFIPCHVSQEDDPVGEDLAPLSQQSRQAASEPGVVSVNEPTPMQQAINAYYDRMPFIVKSKHMHMMEVGISCLFRDGIVTVGSACSGSDVGIVVFETLLGVINERMGRRGGSNQNSFLFATSSSHYCK